MKKYSIDLLTPSQEGKKLVQNNDFNSIILFSLFLEMILSFYIIFRLKKKESFGRIRRFYRKK
jgi:hypothetical protein